MQEMHLARMPEVSPPKRFPFCVVWTPIPVLTWVLPFVGHIGVCLSSGIILDFAGPYYVAMDSLSFGNPTKYWMLDPDLATFPEDDLGSSTSSRSTSADWDKCLQACTSLYQLKPYSLLSQNCHNFVGHFLHQVCYDKKQWSVVNIATALFLKGKFVGAAGFAKTWLPHASLVVLGSIFGGVAFFVCWVLLVIAAGCTWCYIIMQTQTTQKPGIVGLV